jgi:hypothetical protein
VIILNKLLIGPLAIMMSITFLVFLTNGSQLTGTFGVGDPGEIEYTTDGVTNTSTINIPGAGEQNFDIWGSTGAMVVLILALTLGIVAGIGFLGSGLGPHAQKLIFMGTAYLGLWSVFVIMGGIKILDGTGNLGIAFFILLTTIFVIGFVVDANGSSE